MADLLTRSRSRSQRPSDYRTRAAGEHVPAAAAPAVRLACTMVLLSLVPNGDMNRLAIELREFAVEIRRSPDQQADLEILDGHAQGKLVGAVMSSWNQFQVSGRTVIERGDGCHVWDSAGEKRIDWIMGWGSLILGHRPTEVYEGLRKAMDLGFGFMYESPRNGELARLMSDLIPCAQKIRLCNSGTEATLHALRIARAVTGRLRIVKFEGHFHGLNDYLLYGVDGSPRLGALQEAGNIEPVPGSQGLPDSVLSELIIVLPFNDEAALERVFAAHHAEIAAVILEPIALNIGCVAPEPEFLSTLRKICDHYGCLLIFDEVLTGFRVGSGGAQKLFGVTPDLACFGKALGCGVPVAALCGRAQYMDVLSPVGAVEMAGTNTGRHMTVCGTIAAIEAMQRQDVWSILKRQNDRFVSGCRDLLAKFGVPAYVEGWGGRIGIHIGSDQRPRNFRDVVQRWNGDFHRECYRMAHDRMGFFGFLLPLGPCPEPVTLSAAHDDAIVDETLTRFESILRAVPYRHSR